MDRIIEVKVSGNHLKKDNNNAGSRGEANVTLLRITFDEGWDGFAKTVTFLDARGANPVERTLTTNHLENIEENTRVYLVPIPEEPLAIAGRLTFVIDGYLDGKRQRSVCDELVVEDAPIIDDAGEPADPTPTQAEQLQVQIEQILGDIQQVAGAKEETRQYAESAKSYSSSAASSQTSAFSKAAEAKIHADNASFSASKAEIASKRNPIIVDGYWNIWSTQDEGYINTGIKAQAGSTVYIGDNPPSDADVWLDPNGDSIIEGRYLTVGANGDITAEEFGELLNPSIENPYMYDNITLLEDIVVSNVYENDGFYDVRFNSINLNGKTLSLEGHSNVDYEVKSTRYGTLAGDGATYYGTGNLYDVTYQNVSSVFISGNAIIDYSRLKVMSIGGNNIIVKNSTIGSVFAENETSCTFIQNTILGGVYLYGLPATVFIHNTINELGFRVDENETISEEALQRQILIGNAVTTYITPELRDRELATEKYVNNQLQDKADKSTTLNGYGITDAFTKGETRNMLSPLQEQIGIISENLPRVDALEADVEGLQLQIYYAAHFKGYLSTNAKIQELEATPNDFAYSAESGTVWVYAEPFGWEETSVPVPDQLTPASDASPLMNGEATAGILNEYARSDHRHPTDTTRASVEELNSLKSDIEAALDNIIAIQNSLIGGGAE